MLKKLEKCGKHTGSKNQFVTSIGENKIFLLVNKIKKQRYIIYYIKNINIKRTTKN